MGSSVVVEAPPQVDRASVLRPITARLMGAITQNAGPDGHLKLGVKEFTLTISPWERGVLLETRERGLAETVYWGSRLLEALAVQAKGFADLSRLRNEPLSDEQRLRCRQDLVADLALGRAIEAELVAVIAALEAADRRGAARNMTPSRQRLAETMSLLAGDLDESERQVAESLAESLFLEVNDETGCTGMIPTPSGPQPSEAEPVTPASTPHAERGLTRRHLILAGAITFAAVAALTFFLPVLVAGKYDATQAFSYLPGVRGYTGTPPLALVTVSGDTWESLDGPGRTRLVVAIGAAMQKEGFTTVKVLTPDQKPVAEWVKDRGSRLH
ncbi:MAG: hypothetical protein MUF27_08045 [Acidobacteria bacterium]|nr:hypothetical protein [Acidobacteriota bacterium]